MRRRRLASFHVAALAAGLALLALLPGSAFAYLYWANNGSDTIGHANLDGSAADQSFITGASIPCGIAVDGSHIYWANSPAAGTIGRANLDGSAPNQNFITGGTDTCGVAVDRSHVYWANLGSTTIGRANLDGSEPDQSFITGAKGPRGVAVDGEHIYWTNVETGTIGRANLDGSAKKQSFISGASFPCGVAVDSAHVYWANANGASIGRANLDGSSPNQKFITGASHPSGVAVDTLPHPSTTALACAPATLLLPGSATCTATVSDTAAPLSPPSGTVAFSSTGPGALSPTGSCLLVPSAAAAAACQLTYTPSTIGAQTISGAYGGDLAHSQSNGSAVLTVPTASTARPSNSFRLGKPKLNRKTGTATLIATVPGPGGLVLRGKGIKRQARRAGGAGKVKLTIKPAKKTKRRLKKTGTAKIVGKVTYTPTGGIANTESKALKLIRRS